MNNTDIKVPVWEKLNLTMDGYKCSMGVYKHIDMERVKRELNRLKQRAGAKKFTPYKKILTPS